MNNETLGGIPRNQAMNLLKKLSDLKPNQRVKKEKLAIFFNEIDSFFVLNCEEDQLKKFFKIFPLNKTDISVLRKEFQKLKNEKLKKQFKEKEEVFPRNPSFKTSPIGVVFEKSFYC